MKNRIMWARFLDLCHARYRQMNRDLFYVHDVPLIHFDSLPYMNYQRKDFFILISDTHTSFCKSINEVEIPEYIVGKFPYFETCKNINNINHMASLIHDRNNDFYSFMYIDGDDFYTFPAISKEKEFVLIGADSTYWWYADKEATFESYKQAYLSCNI